MPNWTLQPVTRDAIGQVLAFVDSARRELFPALANAPLPRDLAHFSETYLEGEGCCLGPAWRWPPRSLSACG